MAGRLDTVTRGGCYDWRAVTLTAFRETLVGEEIIVMSARHYCTILNSYIEPNNNT